MALRWAVVMRGKSTPLAVLFTSKREEAAGVVVPMPVGPVEGKVFCAEAYKVADRAAIRRHIFMMIVFMDRIAMFLTVQ